VKKIIIMLLLAGIAAGGWFYSQKNQSTAPPAAKAGFGASGPVAVEVLEMQAQNTRVIRQMPGRISAFKVAEIRPRVTGIVIERFFTEGSQVEQGDVLYEIDGATYEAAVALAKADLQKAFATENSVLVRQKRLKELVANKAVSEQEFDDVKADLAKARADIGVAQAALKQAEINLQHTRVTAPISGRIGKSDVTRGALVTMNQETELTRITQLDPVYVDMMMSSAELNRIRPYLDQIGKVQVALQLDNDQNYANQGKLQFADVTVEQTTGAVKIRSLFDNPDGILLPGMFVRVTLSVEVGQALLIPHKSAQREAGGKLYVWVVENNKAVKRYIQTEQSIDNQWMVKQGLEAGDKVVVSGMLKLKPDQEVKL